MAENLNMNDSNARRDLELVLSFFPLLALLRLLRAAKKGLLIRRHYTDAHGRGCILWWLARITSRDECLAYNFGPNHNVLMPAARSLILRWDSGELDDEQLSAILKATIAERRLLNAAEEATIANAGRVSTCP